MTNDEALRFGRAIELKVLRALAAPAQVDAVIEMCAKVCDESSIQPALAKRIRAMKSAAIASQPASNTTDKEV